jgi:16S rRNA (guanine527-N7)-methyltransferase
VAYAELLATEGTTRGLIGPREAGRVWERHLLNCAVVADILPANAAVADIGAGAGLPGLVLAVRRPDLRVTLVEPLLRRARFLEEAVARLDLENAVVRRARAEDLPGELTFDCVTSRAVAPLPRLLDWCLPLVREGGVMVAMKGGTAQDEVLAAAVELTRWGSPRVEVLELGGAAIDPPTTVVRVHVEARTVLRWSRQTPSARRAASPRRGKKRGGRRRDHPGPGT